MIITSKFASRRAKKGLGVKWKSCLVEMGPPTVPVMTPMSIFRVHDFDLPRQNTHNCQKLRDRTLLFSRHQVTFWHSRR